MDIVFPLLFMAVGIWVMSTPFRLIVLTIFGGTLAYVFYIQGLGVPDQLPTEQDEITVFKNYWTLLSVNIGIFLMATYLGLVRRFSSTAALYRQRRLRFFLFAAKWGAIYFAFSMLVRFVLNRSGTDEFEAWALVRSFGVYGFAICLCLYFLLRSRFSSATNSKRQ